MTSRGQVLALLQSAARTPDRRDALIPALAIYTLHGRRSEIARLFANLEVRRSSPCTIGNLNGQSRPRVQLHTTATEVAIEHTSTADVA
jgi:hypothetical protein